MGMERASEQRFALEKWRFDRSLAIEFELFVCGCGARRGRGGQYIAAAPGIGHWGWRKSQGDGVAGASFFVCGAVPWRACTGPGHRAPCFCFPAKAGVAVHCAVLRARR
jgi:hypothetical protein